MRTYKHWLSILACIALSLAFACESLLAAQTSGGALLGFEYEAYTPFTGEYSNATQREAWRNTMVQMLKSAGQGESATDIGRCAAFKTGKKAFSSCILEFAPYLTADDMSNIYRGVTNTAFESGSFAAPSDKTVLTPAAALFMYADTLKPSGRAYADAEPPFVARQYSADGGTSDYTKEELLSLLTRVRKDIAPCSDISAKNCDPVYADVAWFVDKRGLAADSTAKNMLLNADRLKADLAMNAHVAKAVAKDGDYQSILSGAFSDPVLSGYFKFDANKYAQANKTDYSRFVSRLGKYYNANSLSPDKVSSVVGNSASAQKAVKGAAPVVQTPSDSKQSAASASRAKGKTGKSKNAGERIADAAGSESDGDSESVSEKGQEKYAAGYSSVYGPSGVSGSTQNTTNPYGSSSMFGNMSGNKNGMSGMSGGMSSGMGGGGGGMSSGMGGGGGGGGGGMSSGMGGGGGSPQSVAAPGVGGSRAMAANLNAFMGGGPHSGGSSGPASSREAKKPKISQDYSLGNSGQAIAPGASVAGPADDAEKSARHKMPALPSPFETLKAVMAKRAESTPAVSPAPEDKNGFDDFAAFDFGDFGGGGGGFSGGDFGGFGEADFSGFGNTGSFGAVAAAGDPWSESPDGFNKLSGEFPMLNDQTDPFADFESAGNYQAAAVAARDPWESVWDSEADSPAAAMPGGSVKPEAYAMNFSGDKQGAVELPVNLAVHLNKAMSNLELKRYPAVLKECNAVLERVPDNVQALTLTASAYMGMDEYGRAYNSAYRAVAADANSEQALAARSMAAEKLDKYKEMLGDLKVLAELNPDRYNEKFQKAILIYAAEQAPEFLVYSDGRHARPAVAAVGGGAKMSHALKWVLSIILLGGAAMLLSFVLPKMLPQDKEFAMAGPDMAAAGVTAVLNQGSSAVRNKDDEDEFSGTIVGGKYRIKNMMSEGLYGKVFHAVSLSYGLPVVIREIEGLSARSAERVESMFAKFTPLRHLNIAETLGVIKEDSSLYIVSELIEGTSLHALLEKQDRLPLRTALPIFRNISKGLDFLHSRNNANGGLHLSDVILDGDEGFCRIVNVGLGTIIRRDGGIYKAYMAPEGVAKGFSVQFDIYSMGVCLYKTLTGVLPVGNYRLPSEMVPALPKTVDTLIAQALAADPQERLDSVSEFYNLLSQAADEAGAAGADNAGLSALPAGAAGVEVPAPKEAGMPESAAEAMLSPAQDAAPKARGPRPALKPRLKVKTLDIRKLLHVFSSAKEDGPIENGRVTGLKETAADTEKKV
ncbi:MAG: protein kinase [Elusimicrobiaceae bacterium]|nr:protein kinase [Elusimicrobiaceae bacterium]